MEPDEMQAVDKAEIADRYRRLLTDFGKVDSRFSAQTLATEEKKKSGTDSVNNEYDSTDLNLLHRKNSDLDKIHAEESSIRNSAEEKRNQISESAKITKEALNEIAFSHFVNLSDDRNIQIENDIDLVRALEGLVSKAQRSANRIKDEIEDYKKWKKRHSNIIRSSIIFGVLFVLVAIILGIKQVDEKMAKMDTRFYQQQMPEITAPARFRNKPNTLSPSQVKAMLQRNDFPCSDKAWRDEGLSNPQGRGFANDFKKSPSGKVIIDRASGLTWQQAGSDERMTFAEAEEYVRRLRTDRFAGFTDWRLPTLEEAMSLIEPNKADNNLYIDLVFDREQIMIWTADTESSAVEMWGVRVWVVFFHDGFCSCIQIINNDYYVRVVR
jgi:hypothetical protein